MKKLLIFIISLTLCFSLSSCKNGKITYNIESEDDTIASFEVEYKSSQNPGDLLLECLDKNGIAYEVNGEYIESIDGIRQTDDYSKFWGIMVNGEFIMTTLWDADIKSGDIITVRYGSYSM